MALNIPGSVFGRPLQQNNRQTPTQAILGGRQAGAQMQQLDREEEIRRLQAQIQQESTQPGFNPLSSAAVQQLSALDPRGGQDVAATFQALSKERKRAFFDDARKTNRLLKAGKIDDALKVIDNRLSEGDQLAAETGEAFDPSGTLEIQQSIMNGDVAGAISSLDLAEQGGVELGLLKDTGLDARKQEARLTSDERNFNKFQALIRKAKESGLPEDAKAAEQFGRAARLIRATEQEAADIKVSAAQKKEMNKFSVKRRQGFIDSGVEAADSTAVLRRSIDLLDTIKTGGFDNALLNAKKFFGIEGADEGELSANMGKAVLSQLKPIFGAAFTVNEKDELLRLEAGFGKSAANNKRLLKRALKIAERGARRGLAAAEDQEDDFTANEIRASLAFKLEDKDISAEPSAQAPQTTQGVAGDLSDDDLKKILGL